MSNVKLLAEKLLEAEHKLMQEQASVLQATKERDSALQELTNADIPEGDYYLRCWDGAEFVNFMLTASNAHPIRITRLAGLP